MADVVEVLLGGVIFGVFLVAGWYAAPLLKWIDENLLFFLSPFGWVKFVLRKTGLLEPYDFENDPLNIKDMIEDNTGKLHATPPPPMSPEMMAVTVTAAAAREYYNDLLAKGYDRSSAIQYTAQYFPGFQG